MEDDIDRFFHSPFNLRSNPPLVEIPQLTDEEYRRMARAVELFSGHCFDNTDLNNFVKFVHSAFSVKIVGRSNEGAINPNTIEKKTVYFYHIFPESVLSKTKILYMVEGELVPVTVGMKFVANGNKYQVIDVCDKTEIGEGQRYGDERHHTVNSIIREVEIRCES